MLSMHPPLLSLSGTGQTKQAGLAMLPSASFVYRLAGSISSGLQRRIEGLVASLLACLAWVAHWAGALFTLTGRAVSAVIPGAKAYWVKPLLAPPGTGASKNAPFLGSPLVIKEAVTVTEFPEGQRIPVPLPLETQQPAGPRTESCFPFSWTDLPPWKQCLRVGVALMVGVVAARSFASSFWPFRAAGPSSTQGASSPVVSSISQEAVLFSAIPFGPLPLSKALLVQPQPPLVLKGVPASLFQDRTGLLGPVSREYSVAALPSCPRSDFPLPLQGEGVPVPSHASLEGRWTGYPLVIVVGLGIAALVRCLWRCSSHQEVPPRRSSSLQIPGILASSASPSEKLKCVAELRARAEALGKAFTDATSALSRALAEVDRLRQPTGGATTDSQSPLNAAEADLARSFLGLIHILFEIQAVTRHAVVTDSASDISDWLGHIVRDATESLAYKEAILSGRIYNQVLGELRAALARPRQENNSRSSIDVLYFKSLFLHNLSYFFPTDNGLFTDACSTLLFVIEQLKNKGSEGEFSPLRQTGEADPINSDMKQALYRIALAEAFKSLEALQRSDVGAVDGYSAVTQLATTWRICLEMVRANFPQEQDLRQFSRTLLEEVVSRLERARQICMTEGLSQQVLNELRSLPQRVRIEESPP